MNVNYASAFAGTPASGLTNSSQKILLTNLEKDGFSEKQIQFALSGTITSEQNSTLHLLPKEELNEAAFIKILDTIKISSNLSEKVLNCEGSKKRFGLYLTASMIISVLLILIVSFVGETFFGTHGIGKGVGFLSMIIGLTGSGLFMYVFSKNNTTEPIIADLNYFYSLYQNVNVKYQKLIESKK
ncbi:MAG: hypothetical protein HXX09_05785 [Bacteroidetes bacterium]|nr:hypothetical protein [Bacteroidota bacterium]